MISLLLVAAVAFWVLQPVLAGVMVTAGFTISFAVTALPSDESGLATVGVMMVLVGVVVGSITVGLVATGVRRRLRGVERGDHLLPPFGVACTRSGAACRSPMSR